MNEENASATRGLRVKPTRGVRLSLLLGLLMELVMMALGVWPAACLVMHYGPSADAAWQWTLIILGAVVIFNYGYLVGLLLFRIIIPQPVEGFFPLAADGKPPREAIRYTFNALLLKARHDPPWAAMFSSVLTRIYPLRPLFTHLFGPHTESVTMGDTSQFLDPGLVHAGRNVVFGYQCCLVAHVFDQRGLYIRRITIGDNAVIGGESTLMPGVEVGEHAIVASHSLVLPDTKIPPYECWGGVPAKKIKDVERPEDAR